MRVYYKLIVIIRILLSWFPLIVKASWQSDSCEEINLENKRNCKEVSSGYTVPYCVSNEVDNARKCNIPLLVNSLSLKSSDNNDTKDMILKYCSSLLGNQNNGRIYYAIPSTLGEGRDWRKTFDSHQSIFVYALCSSFIDKMGNKVFLVGGMDLSEVFDGDLVKKLRLSQMSDGKDQCSLVDNSSLSNCDMSLYATEIFSALMSDVFKIRYAQVFYVDSVENFQDEASRITAFLSGYFSIKTEYKDLQNLFPQTIGVIKSNQQYYKNVLERVGILNNFVLSEKAKNSKCLQSGNMVGIDFIACALHGSQGTGMSFDASFETLLYNELMFYRIFVAYYGNWVKTKLNTPSSLMHDTDKKILQSSAFDFRSYADLQGEAVKSTLRDFEELSMTYPLHIGLLLHQEVVKKFRDSLSPIITIFYSLSEKLQNVQLPK